MPNPFHLYLIAESPGKTNARRLATVFSLTEGSPLPTETCYSSDEDTKGAAAMMAAEALGQLPQLDGLSPKELRKFNVPGNVPFPFLTNGETEVAGSKAPSGPDLQPPAFVPRSEPKPFQSPIPPLAETGIPGSKSPNGPGVQPPPFRKAK